MKVLLSFTAALDGVANGSLDEKDLAESIFCLGCAPTWPFYPPSDIVSDHRAYQKEEILPEHVETFARHLREAEADDRVIWRRVNAREDRNGFEVHRALSRAFESKGFFPLNPNLPPITDNRFLKEAILRSDKTRSIEVIM